MCDISSSYNHPVIEHSYMLILFGEKSEMRHICMRITMIYIFKVISQSKYLTIQFLLNYSTSTASIPLSGDLEGLEEVFKN